jgi:HAMP domain-containing protein
MTVASVALGWGVAGRALRPLRQMTAAARRISEDNLHERLAVAGPDDELKDLADTIDDLLERLEGAFAAQRRFVANASHELRTPLATMRASLDVAVAKPDPVPAQTVALADRVRAELDQVDELLEGLLVLARAQHGVLPGYQMLSLGNVVSAALAARADAITARDLTVTNHRGRDGAWVAGSQPLLSRMVDNVIDNAIGHNYDGGWIRVSTGANGFAWLVVETGGQVLDQRQVAQLAQPFRRLGAVRTGSDHGAGLGLSCAPGPRSSAPRTCSSRCGTSTPTRSPTPSRSPSAACAASSGTLRSSRPGPAWATASRTTRPVSRARARGRCTMSGWLPGSWEDWIDTYLAGITPAEMREFVTEAWRMVVPKRVAAAHLDRPAAARPGGGPASARPGRGTARRA